jgi:hypothetical protein
MLALSCVDNAQNRLGARRSVPRKSIGNEATGKIKQAHGDAKEGVKNAADKAADALNRKL